MEHKYQVLQTIYDVVKDDPQPLAYKIRPREIILRQMRDWSDIRIYLDELEKEKLIVTFQQDTMVINMTMAGIAKIISLGSQVSKTR